MKNWLIFSIEQNAWWGWNSNGYTSNYQEAGLYTYEEAIRIVKDANTIFKSVLDAVPSEAMIHVSCFPMCTHCRQYIGHEKDCPSTK